MRVINFCESGAFFEAVLELMKNYFGRVSLTFS